MKAVLSYSNILYTHIYTHKRIKDNRLLRRTGLLQHAILYILYATGLNGNSSPHITVEGEELPTKQILLDDVYHDDYNLAGIRGWFCLVLEKEARRKWICKVSDAGFSDSRFGWVCDCGNWTFGDDDSHVPIFSRIKGKVVRGRLMDCRR